MQRKLTDAYCKQVRPPSVGRLEIVDARCGGLVFRVTDRGAKSWSFRFRTPANKHPQRAPIGRYPDLPLADARKAADAMRKAVQSGHDPAELRRKERREAPDRTVQALSERYLREHADRHKRPRSAAEDRRNFDKSILPRWGRRDIRGIHRADVVELIEAIVTAGAPTLANRVQALISKFFSFLIDAGVVEANPAARLRKRGRENVGRRVLSDAELRLFWSEIVMPPVSPAVGLALRLAALTATRASEAAGAAKSEFQHLSEPDKASWLIPGERTKNKRAHLIPLSPLALETVQTALVETADDQPFLFPSPRERSRPINGHALAVAMRRFADRLKSTSGTAKDWKADPPSPHDLRRTVETRLSALGVPKEDRDACLNHVRSDVGSKHYDLYQREKEKRVGFVRLAEAYGLIIGDGAAVISVQGVREASVRT